MAVNIDHNEEIVRLMVLQIRRSFETQDETIAALSGVGFQPARIAELLGIKSNAANQSLQRTKTKAKKAAAKAKSK